MDDVVCDVLNEGWFTGGSRYSLLRPFIVIRLDRRQPCQAIFCCGHTSSSNFLAVHHAVSSLLPLVWSHEVSHVWLTGDMKGRHAIWPWCLRVEVGWSKIHFVLIHVYNTSLDGVTRGHEVVVSHGASVLREERVLPLLNVQSMHRPLVMLLWRHDQSFMFLFLLFGQKFRDALFHYQLLFDLFSQDGFLLHLIVDLQGVDWRVTRACRLVVAH